MRIFIWTFWITIAALLLAGIVALFVRDIRARDACEAKGGVYHSLRGANLCFDPKALIK